MNKLEKVFENKKATIPFLLAGVPTLDKTSEFIFEMARSGADLIILGIPFSDPVAEGELMERAHAKALKNGATVEEIFKMVAKLREKSDIPLVFSTYLNPIFLYGYEIFFKKCRELGIGGVIIADLPLEEKHEVLPHADKNEVALISIIAPAKKERIEKIAESSRGFIYMIAPKEMAGDMAKTIRYVTKTPIAVLLEVLGEENLQKINEYSDGVISGGKIMQAIDKYGEKAVDEVRKCVKNMRVL